MSHAGLAAALPGGDTQAADLPQPLSLQNGQVPTVIQSLLRFFLPAAYPSESPSSALSGLCFVSVCQE